MSLIFPKIIGHRGAKGYAPENTLPSFHTAADMGLEWVEFDVKLTKDEQEMFDNSVNAVKGLVEACKGIDPSLG